MIVHILGAFLVMVALAPSVVCVLEMSTTRGLSPEQYVAVLRSQCSRLAIVGAVELIAGALMLTSMTITPAGSDLWLRLFAVVALVATHAITWVRGLRVIDVCLRTQQHLDLERWCALRRRWERGQFARAILATAAAIAALAALA